MPGSGPLEEATGQRGVAACEVDGGQRAECIRLLVEAGEELLRLLEPALPDAQVRQPHEGRRPHAPVALVEAPGRARQLGLGLGPATGGREDAAVVGPAERGDSHHVRPPHHLLRRAQPLLGPDHVVGPLAGEEHPADAPLDHVQIGHLAGADGGQHLVEQEQPLFHPPGLYEHQRDVAAGLALEVDVPVAPAQRPRLAAHRLLRHRVAVRDDLHDEQPPLLGRVVARALQHRPGPAHPPARDGPLALHVAPEPGHDAGGPAGAETVALVTKGEVGLLVQGDGAAVIHGAVPLLGPLLERSGALCHRHDVRAAAVRPAGGRPLGPPR
jgi:hypothetical protein